METLFKNTASNAETVRDALKQHYIDIKSEKMIDMFNEDVHRFEHFHLQVDDLLLDYSKNRIDQKTLNLLFQLARSIDIETERDQMFAGNKINITEDRAVLHTALRDRSANPRFFNNKDVKPDVNAELEHMASFTRLIQSGEWRGYKNDPITDIVNIGIGGSDLGPKMVCQTLQPYWHPRLKAHFISNLDAVQIEQTLANLNPATTVFIVVSKTFTTQETMTNANTAKDWFLQNTQAYQDINKHFIAVSTNQKHVEEFGIDADNIFGFWDWVGGRYSLWSSVGLSIMLMIGEQHFIELLEGAYAMDRHFTEQPLEQNMPVIMALIGYWYRQYFKTSSHIVLTYDYLLRGLPAYLQQADMESNGKSVDRNGQPVDYPTAPILWGDSGSNGQHSFYQLLHQGTQLVPADFIASMQPQSELSSHHDKVISNVIAQSKALMQGRSHKETIKMLGCNRALQKQDEINCPHMVFEGNRPSNTLFIRKLTPHNLGSLIALYEHKIFVQGILWNIFSYDQWGVELGKQLAGEILPELSNDESLEHDNSTNALINFYRKHKRNAKEANG